MRKTFLKRQGLSEEMGLQITSMADIFMILLVFLLKSFATSVTTVSPSTGIELPVAVKSDAELKDTLKMEISSNSIIIDQKPVVELRNFEFKPGEVEETGRNDAIYEVLANERKRQPVPNMDSTLVLMADQRTPYSTIKAVVGTAASAGFVDLQLVLLEAN